MDIEQELWGMTEEGEAIIRYVMRSVKGAEVHLTNYGAGVLGIVVPDREGRMEDVVLGYATANDYMNDAQHMGKCLGRYAGRIAMGRMTMGEEQVQLERDEGVNHANGGKKGFSERVWESRVETNRVVMSLMSEDGDQNYPGELGVEVVFDFDDNNTFEITYLAKSSKRTAVNLTHQIFFNLRGESHPQAMEQTLLLHAHRVCEMNGRMVPTGTLLDVEGTPQDFTHPRKLSEGIDEDFNQMDMVGGYEHAFMVDDWQRDILVEIATLEDETSGRKMTLLSSQPAVVVNSANLLQGSCPKSKSGRDYADHQGVALMAQHLPDAMNHAEFPSPLVDAEQLYCQKTVYRFETTK